MSSESVSQTIRSSTPEYPHRCGVCRFLSRMSQRARPPDTVPLKDRRQELLQLRNGIYLAYADAPLFAMLSMVGRLLTNDVIPKTRKTVNCGTVS